MSSSVWNRRRSQGKTSFDPETGGAQQRFFSGLLRIASMHGYQRAWVNHHFMKRWGVGPPSDLAAVSREPSKEVIEFVADQRDKWLRGRP